MKKTYRAPALTVLHLEGTLPLLSSATAGQPTIGNGYDEAGAKDQFSPDKEWSDTWPED